MPRRILTSLTRLLSRALELAAAGLEAALSRRGLTLLFFLILFAFAAGAWVHPPLSRDIRGVELPLGLLPVESSRVEAVLYGPTRIEPLGAGTLMLVLIAVGAVVALRRPRRIERVAGALLCAAIGLGATALFNHPLLVDRLHEEARERVQIAALFERLDVNGMTRPGTARVRSGPRRPSGSAPLGGLPFAGTWRWMVLVAAAGYLLAGDRPLRRRLAGLAGWLALGGLLATGLCGRRLVAEHLWNRGNRLEAIGRFEDAGRSLRRAERWSPELRDLGRHRHLLGRIDYLEGRETPEAWLFFARRSRELGDLELATATLHRLPGDERVVRHELARVLVAKGRERCFQGRWDEARAALEQVGDLTPIEYDGALYLAMAYRRLGATPEVIEKSVEPILRLSSDRALHADAMVVLGDALFDAGRLAEARDWYLTSLRTFDLPKQINYEAREGLLGL